MTEFPPGYSLFLSYFIRPENDLNATIRWINICLFAIFLILFSILIFSSTRNLFLALVGIFFCLYSPVLLEIFSGSISETLFLPLLIGIFILFLKYIQEKNKIHFILLAVLSCLLPIIRYAGMLFIFTIGLALLLFDQSKMNFRIRKILVFFAVSFAPIGIWLLKLYCMFSVIGGRDFRFDANMISSFFESVKSELVVISTWLPYYGTFPKPEFDQIYFYGILFAALLGILWISFRLFKNRKKLNQTDILFALLLFAVCAYLFFIAFTHSITIPQIDIINRMLAPIYPLTIALLISALSLHAYKSHKPLYFIFTAITLFSLRFTAYKSRQYIYNMQQDGHGYSARQYHQSDIIHQIKALPDERNLISNSAGFVLYYINRLPMQINQFANHAFGSKNGYGEMTFREKGAYLILLYPDFFNYYGEQADQLLSTITSGLDVVYQDDIGGIYTYPKTEAIPQ